MYKHLVLIGLLLLIIAAAITFLETKILREYFSLSLDNEKSLEFIESEIEKLRNTYSLVMTTYKHAKKQITDNDILVSEKLSQMTQLNKDIDIRLKQIILEINALKKQIENTEVKSSKLYTHLLRLFRIYVFEGKEIPPLVEEEES